MFPFNPNIEEMKTDKAFKANKGEIDFSPNGDIKQILDFGLNPNSVEVYSESCPEVFCI